MPGIKTLRSQVLPAHYENAKERVKQCFQKSESTLKGAPFLPAGEIIEGLTFWAYMLDMVGKQVTIRALAIEKDGGGWVVQCLDYDIVAQAKTLADLSVELERLLVSHVAVSLDLGREPFAGFTPAPQRFWDLYERAQTKVEFESGHTPAAEAARDILIAPFVKYANERELALA